MLADVPGKDVEEKLTHYIGSYMALQIELQQTRAQVEKLSACASQVSPLRETLRAVEAALRKESLIASERVANALQVMRSRPVEGAAASPSIEELAHLLAIPAGRAEHFLKFFDVRRK
ncbi:hypothetical protein [Bradyrhizobium sp. SEMIA]|uniref:hypothetical protein n=1 Tax=Bradyrhizobium sp. SEMIA TaxID=2597515 RepID=UPI0018A681C6|nr:hypothetical protein [Bradyrhizobium sp. SEMIA]QOG20432.1 hypothetical protein FOM02_26865 [Bradyrhizobium sp. SEMIA]